MRACLSFNDILEVGRAQIQAMQSIGDAYSSAEAPGACVAFTRQVRIVEGIVVQTYGVAASLARKAEDLTEIGEIWTGMSLFCRSALTILSSLKHKYPFCGTNELYDMVLDYKLACEKRYKGAMEELSCQSTSLPKGLLPEMK
jgi:hypothetical protein